MSSTFRVSSAVGEVQQHGLRGSISPCLEGQSRRACPASKPRGITSHLPFEDTLPNWYSYFWPAGAPKINRTPSWPTTARSFRWYFKSMGVTFLTGRDFDEHDVEQNLHLAIIDDTVAEQSWPGQPAVGQLLNVENGTRDTVRDNVQVIGVVKHLQYHTLTDQVRGQIYLLYPLAIRTHMAFTLKSKLGAPTLLPLIRREEFPLSIRICPIYHVEFMTEYFQVRSPAARFVTLLACVMAGIALLLASTGIYAITRYSVVQRTANWASALLLAQAAQLFGLVVRQSMLPVALGVAIGVVLSLLLTPLLSLCSSGSAHRCADLRCRRPRAFGLGVDRLISAGAPHHARRSTCGPAL